MTLLRDVRAVGGKSPCAVWLRLECYCVLVGRLGHGHNSHCTPAVSCIRPNITNDADY